MDDDQLIAAIAAGDDTALRALFSRHAPWLAARLRSVLPAPDVEDVLQETFLAVWRGAGSYRPQGAAGGWLWGVARRQAALFLRRRGPAGLTLPTVIEADGQPAVDPAEAALARAAPALGGAFGWTGPLAYLLVTEVALTGKPTTPWVWAARPPHDLGGALCAAVVLVAGTAAVTLAGTRDSGHHSAPG